MSEVLERLIYYWIIDFVVHSISPTQFCFLLKMSFVQRILIKRDLTFNSCENRSLIEVLYLDFQKAFDSMSHSKLLLLHFLTVFSGASQGSILRQVLFLIYITYLPLSLSTSSSCLLHEDDKRCFKSINSLQDIKLLQHDLDAID